MLHFDFEALATLGLTPALASRAVSGYVPAPEEGDAQLVRVTEVHRETVAFHDGVIEASARPLPRLVRSLIDQETALAAGDWAIAFADAFGQHWIVDRIAPTSHITRRDAEGARHPVVSNVDVAVLVMGLDDDFNPRRLERFIALVHGEAIVPVVVLTKADIVPVALLEDRVASVRRRISPHIDIVAVDATAPSAVVTLQPYVAAGTTLVMLGSSGAGKSTLTNTLIGTRVQDTGAVREADGRGKHTTTSRSLHRLPGGACVIDTPGVRTLRPDGDESALAESFGDIEALAAECRFRDCEHAAEPGCAVRARVEPDRLRNYQKMLREVRRDRMTALERQRQVAQFKVRGRAVREKMRIKRGIG